MPNTIMRKKKRRGASALDMAVARKNHASMSVRLESGRQIEGVSEGVDEDFALLSAQLMARDSWREAEELNPRRAAADREREQKVAYKGNEIRLLTIGMLYAEPIELFDGAVLELGGAKGEAVEVSASGGGSGVQTQTAAGGGAEEQTLTDEGAAQIQTVVDGESEVQTQTTVSGESGGQVQAAAAGAPNAGPQTGGAAGKEIRGTGGTLVLALSDMENIVVVPLEGFQVSGESFRATAKKKSPSDGSNTLSGFIRSENIIFQAKSASGKDRIVSAGSLDVEDEKIHLNDAREYDLDVANRWEEIPEGMDADRNGLSIKQTPAERHQAELEERERQARHEDHVAVSLNGANTASPTLFDGVRRMLQGNEDEEEEFGAEEVEAMEINREASTSGNVDLDQLRESIERAKQDIENAVQALEDGVRQGWEQLQEAVAQMPENVREQFATMRTAMKESAEELKNKVAQEIAGLSPDQVSAAMERELGELKRGVASVDEAMKEMTGQIASGICKSAKAIYAVPSAAVNYVSTSVEKMQSAVVGACNAIKDGFADIRNITEETYRGFKNTVTDTFQFLEADWNSFKDTIRNVDLTAAGRALLEETAMEQVEDLQTRVSATIDAARGFLAGDSEEQIKAMLLDKYQMTEAESEKKGLVDLKPQMPSFIFPILPLFQIKVDTGFEVKLDTFFDKPSLDDLKEKQAFTVGTGLQGLMKLEMSAGGSLGVPVFAELFAGLEGELEASGEGAQKKLLAGELNMPFEVMKTPRGESILAPKADENPTLDLVGALELVGRLAFGAKAQSIIWGIDKDLYKRELGEWKLLGIRLAWHLVRNAAGGALLDGWELQGREKTVEAGGRTIYDSAVNSPYVTKGKDIEVIVSGSDRSHKAYQELMEKFRAFKNKQPLEGVGAIAIAPGSEAFKNMVGEAKEIEENLRNLMMLDFAQIKFAVDFLDRYISLNEYRKNSKAARDRLAKHGGRVEAINSAGGDSGKLESLAAKGYSKWLEETANRIFLFKDCKAYIFYRNKRREAAYQKGGIDGLKVADGNAVETEFSFFFRREFEKAKKEDKNFGKDDEGVEKSPETIQRETEFVERYIKEMKKNKVEVLVRSFADRKLILDYEKKNMSLREAAVKDKLKKITDKKEALKGIADKERKVGNLGWLFTEKNNVYRRLAALEEQAREEARGKKKKKKIDEAEQETLKHLLGLDDNGNPSGPAHPDALMALRPEAMKLVIERYYQNRFESEKDNRTSIWLDLVKKGAGSSKEEDADNISTSLQGGLAGVLSLKDIFAYEEARKNHYKKLRDEAEDENAKTSYWARYINHAHRVGMLRASIDMLSDPSLTEEEKKAKERHLILKYFQGYEVVRGRGVSNEGFAQEVLRGRYSTESITTAITSDYERRVRSLNEKAQLFAGDTLDEGTADSHLISAVDYLRSLSEDDRTAHVKALQQLTAEKLVKADSVDMEQYRQAKSWNMGCGVWHSTKDGILVECADRVLQYIAQNPEREDFVKRFEEIWGKKYQAHVEYLVGNFPYEEIGDEEILEWYRYDDEWKRRAARRENIEGMEDEPRLQTVNAYLGSISDADEKSDFLKWAADRLALMLRPRDIYQYEKHDRFLEEAAYTPIVNLLDEVMDKKNLKEAAKNPETQKRIYNELIGMNTEYFKEKSGEIKSMLGQMKKDKSAYSPELMLEYENARKTYYEEELAKAEKPRRQATEAINQMTKEFAELTDAVRELEGILANPNAFVESGTMGESHPLEQVARMTEREFNNPAPNSRVAERSSEALQLIEELGASTVSPELQRMYENRQQEIDNRIAELADMPVLAG